MKTGRDKKIAEEIRREVSQILHFEMSDPRLIGVTITGVKVSSDLRFARIYFGTPGAEVRKEPILNGLKKSTGHVRHLLAGRLNMKFVPQIEFFYDESFEIEARLQQIFKDMPKTEKSEE